jgi:hypothetical protein
VVKIPQSCSAACSLISPRALFFVTARSWHRACRTCTTRVAERMHENGKPCEDSGTCEAD